MKIIVNNNDSNKNFNRYRVIPDWWSESATCLETKVQEWKCLDYKMRWLSSLGCSTELWRQVALMLWTEGGHPVNVTYVGRFIGGRQWSAASDGKKTKKKTLQYFESEHLGARIGPAEERPGQDAGALCSGSSGSVCRDLKTRALLKCPRARHQTHNCFSQPPCSDTSQLMHVYMSCM